MNETFNSKIDDLYGRINYRLNSAILASDDEFVTAYDLACITYMSMKKYNAILVDYAKRDADSVNRRTFFKNIFFISVFGLAGVVHLYSRGRYTVTGIVTVGSSPVYRR